MDVKPWEPVSGYYVGSPRDPLRHDLGVDWPFLTAHYLHVAQAWTIKNGGALRVTLANGQRIIVRTLSDERKAARAAMKGAAQ